MKSIIAILISLTVSAAFAEVTPMNIVEEASYALKNLTKKNQINESFLTDTTAMTMAQTATGFVATLYSPSANSSQFNTVTVSFDTNGKPNGFSTNFVSRYTQGPIFNRADSAEIFDLGAEAIVDHLTENADLPVVAKTAQSVQVTRSANGLSLKIKLKDGRVYSVNMNEDATVLSQGF